MYEAKESTINQARGSARVITAFPTTGEVRSVSTDISLRTTQTNELLDVTEDVRAAVRASQIEEGLVLVSSPHTTCAVIVNEDEQGFARDFGETLERLAPRHGRYHHDLAPHEEEFEGPNGYAHVRAALLGSPSITLPIHDGELALGRWQRIFFVELDRARPRTCRITLLGRA